jgi:hypothetical protein
MGEVIVEVSDAEVNRREPDQKVQNTATQPLRRGNWVGFERTRLIADQATRLAATHSM